MKKNIFAAFLIAMLFHGLTAGFAATSPEEAEDAVEKTLAFADDSKETAAEEFSEEDAFPDETSDLLPVATVSDSNPSEEPVAAVKVHEGTAEIPAATRSPRRASSGKDRLPSKASATKSKISAALNTAEMRKQWDALFSKEIVPGSKSYTVKSGDSLYVIARKHHTTVDLIKKANDLKSDDIYPGMKFKVQTAPFSIMVDKSRNILVLYSGDEPVKKYSVATGKDNKTPVGEFKITDKLVNPTWFKTGAIFPPGSPENALGTRWMGFDKPAYGIHGTIEPKSIGTQASEGCIRMLNEDVEELYSLVPSGTKVSIQD